MYSLGLGHIEFDPKHTIEEHRLPVHNQTQSPIANNTQIPNAEQSTQSDLQLTIRAELEKKLLGHTLDENQTVEFHEIHDPKHRHTRESSGKSDVV